MECGKVHQTIKYRITGRKQVLSGKLWALATKYTSIPGKKPAAEKVMTLTLIDPTRKMNIC
jgi:hypothetical protein